MQHRRRTIRRGVAGLLTLILCIIVADLHAADGVWISTGGGNWSDTNNWTEGVIADGPGSTADFRILDISADTTVTLDSPRTVGQLLFRDTTASHNWILNGTNVLTLDNGASLPVIGVSNRTAKVQCSMTGTNGFTKLGNGTLSLESIDPGANSIAGKVYVTQGQLLAEDDQSFVNVGGPIDIADGAQAYIDGDFSPNLSVPCDWIVRGNGTSGNGSLQSRGNARLTGLITLAEDAIIASNWNWFWLGTLNQPNSIVITGADKNLQIHALRSSQPGARVEGVIATGSGSVTTWGDGYVTFRGVNTYTGETLIGNRRLYLEGSGQIQQSAALEVAAGSVLDVTGISSSDFWVGSATNQTLRGDGIVDATGKTLKLGSHGRLEPGLPDSAGKLAVTGNVEFAEQSVYHVTLHGDAAGSGYDQLSVDKTLTLATSGSGVTLSVELLDSYLPAIGVPHDIVVGCTSITGTFYGIPDGGTLTSGGRAYRIDYDSGAGKVTLTRAPDGTVVFIR